MILTSMLLISGCGSSGGSSNSQKPMTNDDVVNDNKVVKNLPIVIIGPSTVYIAKEQNSSLKYKDDSECPLYGWGELLPEFAQDESIIYNYARQGAGAGTFKDIEYDNAPKGEKVLYGPNHDHYWAKTKEKMQELDNGILLIQFGGNDPRHIRKNYPNITDNEMLNIFRKNIEFYIDEAQKMNFIPILITSPDKRIRDNDTKIGNHRGDFPNVVKELAVSRNIRVLDLHQKTLTEFNKYTDKELNVKFADCYNKWRFRELVAKGSSKNEAKKLSKENTHYEKHGAKTVASWIKELACQEPNSTLCKQFK